MKRSALRVCCAVLLMGLIVTASVVLIGAATEEKPVPKKMPETYVWMRMQLVTEPRAEEIFLYNSEGQPIQRLQTDKNGRATSELMTPGRYYAATEGCCAEFTLKTNASVALDGGCGWSDGEILYLTGTAIGTVTLERAAPALDEDGWLDYTLKNDGFERREVIRCSAKNGVLTCTFEGVPYGSYVLSEDGVECCTVTVSEKTPDVTVTLP